MYNILRPTLIPSVWHFFFLRDEGYSTDEIHCVCTGNARIVQRQRELRNFIKHEIYVQFIYTIKIQILIFNKKRTETYLSLLAIEYLSFYVI
jgi:hypothetical protein